MGLSVSIPECRTVAVSRFRPWSAQGRHTMLSEGIREPICHACSQAQGSKRLQRTPRPGDGTSDGGTGQARLNTCFSFYAAAASLPQRKSLPSIHIRCSTVASLRAKATLARFMPRRLATSMAQRFKVENRCDRVSSVCAAS